jgi:uncharacterized damage-inducible protein DinB
MSTLTNLIATLDQERALLLDAVKKVPDEALTLKGVVGAWSIKNMLAHLADQECLVIQVLPQRLATGSAPEIVSIINADADAWNAKQIEASEHLTLSEQLKQLEQARQELVQVIRDVGEEGLTRQHPWPEWPGTVAAYILQVVGEHERGHRETILAALEKGLQARKSGTPTRQC